MKHLKYFTELQEHIKPEDWNLKELPIHELHQRESYHLGSFQDLDYINKDSEEYKMFKYVFENIIPPTKIIKWGDILEQRKNKSFI